MNFRKNTDTNTNNRFKFLQKKNTNTFLHAKKKAPIKEKPPTFNINNENFPGLNPESSQPSQPSQPSNYLKCTETATKTENTVNNKINYTGWTIMKFDENNKIVKECYRTISEAALIEHEEKLNHQRNLWVSEYIMNERNKHRQEMNDILGDISPYWNIDKLYTSDTIYYDDDYYSDESDNEFYEEYY
jgi:hypothetical protein